MADDDTAVVIRGKCSNLDGPIQGVSKPYLDDVTGFERFREYRVSSPPRALDAQLDESGQSGESVAAKRNQQTSSENIQKCTKNQ